MMLPKSATKRRHIFSPLSRLATICCTVLPLLAGAAQATPVVDQQNLGPVTGNVGYLTNLSRGQSFTVGIDGLLAGFEFQFNKSQARATGNAYLSVYSTNGSGAPDTLLGQESLAASAVGTTHSLVYFDLTSLNISVSAGDLMFAALSADFNGGMHSTTDLYADGSEWGCGPALLVVCWTAADNGIPDLVFRSHVEPLPTSGTLALLGLGLAGLGFVRRRHAA